MLYELLFPLRHGAEWLGWLNVLRYLPFRAIAATVTAISSALGRVPSRNTGSRCQLAAIRHSPSGVRRIDAQCQSPRTA